MYEAAAEASPGVPILEGAMGAVDAMALGALMMRVEGMLTSDSGPPRASLSPFPPRAW